MDSTKTDEQIIKCALALLSSLISPVAEESGPSTGEIREFDDALYVKLSSVLNSESFKRLLNDLQREGSSTASDSRVQVRWNFVRMCLLLMDIVRDTISRTEDSRLKLLSVAEKKVLETTFQFVVSLAVLPYLLPGVGVSLEKRSRHFADVKAETLNDLAKYKRLSFTIDALLNLRSVDVFHEIIIARHMEDVLAALVQLSFVPFKKPASQDVSEAVTQISLESLDDNYEIDTMTYSLWAGLENNRKRFKSKLEELQGRLYRPLLIRSYMILLYSKKVPPWMRKSVTSILTKLFLEEDGVIAAVKAIIVDNESPASSSHCVTVSKLISSIFCHEVESKMKLLPPQIEKILAKERREPYDYVYANVIASAVCDMLKTDRKRTKEHLLDVILKPLRNITASNEVEISKSIIQMYNLCIMPSNKTVAVPISVIESVSLILCFVYAHIKDGICYLKTPVKELLARFLQDADKETLSRLFDGAVFHENASPETVAVPQSVKIALSANGGMNVVEGESIFSELENGVMLFQLIKGSEEHENLISSLFIYLLKKYIHFSADGNFSKERVIVVFLLAQLSQDSETLKHIMKNAESIILFVQELLNIHYVEDEQNADVIRVCLNFLTMVLCDLHKKEDVNWQIFTSLLPALDKLINSHLPDVMMLADEVRNLIATHGVIGGSASEDIAGKSKPLIEEILPSACERAVEDACDPLLPVRAHALMELIELLKKGDAETLAKKEKIFLVFEENLKDEDSFLYLRAIEGLACLAVLMPDNVLPLLCQEFQGSNLSASVETRLKIGEILMRTIKPMNDFLLPRKHLLINTFMNGAKDEDSVIRASSLSNLSELCLTLRWNIEDVLYEIIECAREALFDPSLEPRRAAALLIGSLFRGLAITTFEVKRLLELYRTLKHIRSNEEDEVMRTQSQLSLDNLNEIMKDFFVTKPVMEKRIHILDYHK